MEKENDQRRLLEPLAAAHHLGVTPELLFEYTKPSFAKTSGLRKLESVEYGGASRFAISELDEFDSILAGEWPSVNGRRPTVPKAIQDHLHAESFNQCARCPSGIGVENAHIKSWVESRSNHPANLIRLCSACHKEHDRHKSYLTNELQVLKDKLVNLTKFRLMMRLQESSNVTPYPRPITQFVGREKELATVVKSLRSERSMMITGAGGIGKTELLVKAISVVNCDRPVYWINVEKHQSTSDALSALRAELCNGQMACPEDKVPVRLDSLEACVVFDGVERTIPGDIDAFEDALVALLRSTARAQFVITSQYTMHGFLADTHLELGPLTPIESSELFKGYQPIEKSTRTDNCSSLLEFCEGHALTIRLAASLRIYYGSADAALNAINASGVSKLRHPTRKTQNPHTSLELCLQTAYSALSRDAQELLLTLSEAPSGLFVRYLEEKLLGIDNPVETIAELRQWHLVEFTEAYECLVRTHVLNPIRAFSIERAQKGDRSQYERVLRRLSESHLVMVAVIEKSDDPNEIPYTVSRYEAELPNLLRILKVARENRNDVELGQVAITIVRPTIQYFFVRGLPEQGARVMHDAAELAMWIGKPELASGLILQLVSIADRANDKKMLQAGLDLVDKIEDSSEGAEVCPDMSMCRGIIARHNGDIICAERHARTALKGYSIRLREIERMQDSGDHEEDEFEFNVDELYNEISHAMGLLGFTLFEQKKYEKAQSAYNQSLQHQRGASIGVNRGQTLHQLGNCASHLEQSERAIELYLSAAKIFHIVEMEQYLSNAIGEFGYALIDAKGEFPLDGADIQILDAALSDLSKDICRVFAASQSIDHSRAIGIIRKTYGCMASAILSGNGDLLGKFLAQLAKDVIPPIKKQVTPSERDTDERFPFLMMMEAAFLLGICASEAEQSYIEDGDISRDVISNMLLIICNSPDWARETMRITDWLSALLSKRWQFQGASSARLEDFVQKSQGGVEDYLDISR